MNSMIQRQEGQTLRSQIHRQGQDERNQDTQKRQDRQTNDIISVAVFVKF